MNNAEEKKVGNYSPIPQWLQKEDKIIGIKDLYIVKTCGSDHFIRVGENTIEVLDATMKKVLLAVSTMEDAVKFIKESCEANLVYGYKVIFEFPTENFEVYFKSNAPKKEMKHACNLFPYKGELISLISKEKCPEVFIKLVKEVLGYYIQEESSLPSAEVLNVTCKNTDA